MIRLRLRKPARGTATVEFALILPLFLGLLFSIIEFGFIFRNLMIVQQACREGARAAAVGKSTTDVNAAIIGSLADLSAARLTKTLQYRTLTLGVWSSWVTLGDAATTPVTNNAPQGAQVRVKATYSHRLLTGALFARMIGQPGATTINLNSQMVMRRE